MFDEYLFVVLHGFDDHIFPEGHMFEALGHGGILPINEYMLIIDKGIRFDQLLKYKFVCGIYLVLVGKFCCVVLTQGLPQYRAYALCDDMYPYDALF